MASPALRFRHRRAVAKIADTARDRGDAADRGARRRLRGGCWRRLRGSRLRCGCWLRGGGGLAGRRWRRLRGRCRRGRRSRRLRGRCVVAAARSGAWAPKPMPNTAVNTMTNFLLAPLSPPCTGTARTKQVLSRPPEVPPQPRRRRRQPAGRSGDRRPRGQSAPHTQCRSHAGLRSLRQTQDQTGCLKRNSGISAP